MYVITADSGMYVITTNSGMYVITADSGMQVSLNYRKELKARDQVLSINVQLR